MTKFADLQGFKVELKIRDMDRGDRGDMGGGVGKHDKNKKSTRQVGGGGWWLGGLQVIDYSFHLKSTR